MIPFDVPSARLNIALCIFTLNGDNAEIAFLFAQSRGHTIDLDEKPTFRKVYNQQSCIENRPFKALFIASSEQKQL